MSFADILLRGLVNTCDPPTLHICLVDYSDQALLTLWLHRSMQLKKETLTSSAHFSLYTYYYGSHRLFSHSVHCGRTIQYHFKTFSLCGYMHRLWHKNAFIRLCIHILIHTANESIFLRAPSLITLLSYLTFTSHFNTKYLT